MEIISLGPGFVAEMRDISLLDVATSDEAYNVVRAAFEEHSVLLFRDQTVTDDLQVAYSRAFGPLEITKIGSVGSGTFYGRLTNIGSDGSLVPPTHRQALTARANQLWHTDSSFKQTPRWRRCYRRGSSRPTVERHNSPRRGRPGSGFLTL